MPNLDLRTILGDSLSPLAQADAAPASVEAAQPPATAEMQAPAAAPMRAPAVTEPKSVVPAPSPAAPGPTPVRSALAAATLDPQVVALVEQSRSVIVGLGRGDGAKAIQVLGEHIERVGSFIIRQMAELGAARAEIGRLAAERDRLSDENQQMRNLLRSMLNAIESDKRRTDEAIVQIRERLSTLLPTGAAATTGTQPEPVPSGDDAFAAENIG